MRFVRASGRELQIFLDLVADTPEVTVCLLFLLFRCCILLCGDGDAWWWRLCVGDFGAVLVRFGWMVIVFLDLDLVLERFADESYIRGWLVLFTWGGGCLLGGDSFWRLPLLLGSLFVVTISCLCFFRLLRCLGCLEGAGPVVLSLFLLIGLLFALLSIMSFVLLFGCWFSMGRLTLLRDRESVSSCNLVGLDLVFLWCTGGEGVSFWFGHKVWWADHFWFVIGSQFFSSSLVLGFLWFLSVDRRSRGGGSWLIFLDVAQLWCWGLGV